MDWTDVDTVYPPEGGMMVVEPWLTRMGEVREILRETQACGAGLFAMPACGIGGAPTERNMPEAREAFEQVRSRIQNDQLLRVALWLTIIVAARESINAHGPVEVWEYAVRRLDRVERLEEVCTHEDLFKVAGGQEVLCPVCSGEDPPPGSEAIKRSETFV